MAQKKKPAIRRSANDLAQLKVRLPEHLRRQLMYAARRANHSMNVEIVNRLNQSFFELNRAKIIASALVDTLDPEVLDEMQYIFQEAAHDDDDYGRTLDDGTEK